VTSLRAVGVTLAAMAASLLPFRLWRRLPGSFQMGTAAFLSATVTFFLGAAIGISGFLGYAHLNSMRGVSAIVDATTQGHEVSGSPGFNGLALFEFLLLTPKGWATLYLMVGGGFRMAAAWFDDPMGDPILTAVDYVVLAGREKQQAEAQARSRLAAEGPEVPDRIVSPASAGISGCDFVIVSSRRKPGWEFGAGVYTQHGVYRLGLPIERTIAGHLRYFYPLTEHADFEAIRKSVHYDLPT